jgi:citrate lyase subunit beta / citryl-CoA lyase
MVHPRHVLMGSQAGAVTLPVCDHYCGIEARIAKSLQLQAEMLEEFGTCVFDVTLDCEDGAPVGGEIGHANMVAASVLSACAAPKSVVTSIHQANYQKVNKKAKRRIAARVHAVDHASFESDIETIVGKAGAYLSHVMVPKVDTLADVERAVALIDAALTDAANKSSQAIHLPIHVLLESPKAIHNAFDIAAHPRVQSLSFGLMDFVSSHGGAIPASAMGLVGQFEHPLVIRAKLAIASACHAHGKVPSHCVVTEFSDVNAIKNAALQAANTLGFTRMWSIHPSQIRPILAAFSPDASDIDVATQIITAGVDADWAPISYKGALHDRASYRYYWQVLERAHQTGRAIDTTVAHFFSD